MTKKILYSSVDRNGRQNSGFVEAETNSEALQILRDQGHAEVRFYGDGAMTSEAEQALLAPFDDRNARFQIRIRHRPDFVPVLLQSLYNNRVNLVVGIGMLLYGWYYDKPVVVYAGIGIIVFIPLFTAWKHRATRRFEALQANFALGHWERVLRDIAFLRKHQVGSEMAFDLDLREAVARFKLTGATDAVDALDQWRELFDAEMPGYFESRMASLQHHLGRPDRYLELMREAFFKSSMSPLILTDLALAEARLGDVGKATTLQQRIAAAELPVEGTAYLHWIDGLIAYRSGRSGAADFAATLESFAQFGDTPTLWPALAVCVGDWATHAPDADWLDHDIASRLAAVWPVLAVQGEADTVKGLAARLRGADGQAAA